MASTNNYNAWGIAGFSHIEGSYIYYVLYVRGKHCYRIPLIYPIYFLIQKLYKWKIEKNLREFTK